MAKPNSHTDPKWDQLLNAYREGKLNPDELHRLEKAALDDPFLFDAMEGYALHQSTADATNIQELKDLSSNQKPKIRSINYFKWASVAALFLLLLAVTFVMRDEFGNQEKALTTNSDIDKTADSEPIAEIMNTEDNNNVEAPEASKPIQKPPVENKASDAPKTKIEEEIVDITKKQKSPGSSTSLQEQNKDIDDDLAIAENDNSAEVSEVAAMNLKEALDKPALPPAAQVFDGAAMKRKKSEIPSDNNSVNKVSRLIKGEIVDEDGMPLIGANVNIENTEVGTITDVEGKFTLPTYPSGIQMVSSYTGYEPEYTMIQSDSFYSITLTENQMLDEVVVTDLSILATEEEAMPEVGYEGLEEFIRQYKSIPIGAFSANFKGNITVEFLINEDGTLSDFTSEDEGCNACIKEAIRLLKLSGKWKTVPEGIKRKASYTISF